MPRSRSFILFLRPVSLCSPSSEVKHSLQAPYRILNKVVVRKSVVDTFCQMFTQHNIVECRHGLGVAKVHLVKYFSRQ